MVCNSLAQVRSLLEESYTPPHFSGTVKKHLSWLEDSGISLSYSDAFADLKKKIVLPEKSYTVGEVLRIVFDGQGVELIEKENKILIVPSKEVSDSTKEFKQRTINGFILEAGSNEVLVSAVVYAPGTPYGTVTNTYGYYSLVLPSYVRKIVYSYVGYKPDTLDIAVSPTDRKDVKLKKRNELDEIVVRQDVETSADHTHITGKDIENRPALIGENDVMRALQYEAGVQSSIDGSTSLLVRGGNPGQNLNLLDGVPLYYVDHFFGFTSVFNPEAIKSVDFHKGAFPARYGGRLSSVIDVTTKDGDMEEWGGQFNMGLVKGGLSLEGPLIKNKSSIILTARRTWLDVLWKPISKNPSINFYDLNGKANYIINKNNRLYLSFYNGRDLIRSDIDDGEIQTKWGNTISSLKWNSVINPKLFVNTILTYSTFHFNLDDTRQVIQYGGISNANDYTGSSTIEEVSQNIRANWNVSYNHDVEFGIKTAFSTFVPVSIQSRIDPTASPAPISSRFSMNEVTLFAEDDIQLNDEWRIRPGIHWATWFNKDFNYSALQPRFYISYEIAPQRVLHGSFTQMSQYLHLLNSNTYGLPTDFWVPSTSIVEPEEALMGTLGYKAKTANNFTYSINLYYKDIKGLVMYNVGKDLFDNTLFWEDKIVQGTGWGYGAELSAEKTMGSFTASAAYTLSWSWRKFSMLNNGEPFPYRYDRRHNFKSSIVYKRKKFEAAASWVYMSGEAITLPDQLYPDFDRNLMIDPGTPYYSNYYTYNIADWNNYRLPAIHRLDVGFKFIKQRKRAVRTWSVGVFNVYARPNVLYAELSEEVDGDGFKLYAVNVLQFIPYVNYKLNF